MAQYNKPNRITIAQPLKKGRTILKRLLHVKKYKITILLVCLLACIFNIDAQNIPTRMSIDINAKSIQHSQTQQSTDTNINRIFNNADRFRQYDYNPQLANLRSNNVGDTLLLNFFDDKQYKSVIQRVNVNFEGRTSITSNVVESEFAYCYIVVSATTISITAELPLEDEYFFASVKNGQAYIGEMMMTELKKDILEDSGPLMPDLQNNNVNPSYQSDSLNDGNGVNDTVTLDVLVVYTQAAEDWALANSGQTDIFDLIIQAIDRANTIMRNSNTDITFNMVYAYKTDYIEANNNHDLERITVPSDGYMDEVHDLRDVYFADVVLFIPSVTFTGGVAWLLNYVNGFANGNLAFALSRVQQSANSYTAVHEIGHNMGCGHHPLQSSQPGPGLFNYSAGWKGLISGNKFCSAMSYEAASEYNEPTPNYTRIPYFSSPNIIYGGVTIGDSSTMDNTRTLRETKTVTANYRTPPTIPTITVSHSSIDFFEGSNDTTKLLAVSGLHLSGNISYSLGGVNAGAFRVNIVQWDTAIGGILQIVFTDAPGQNYQASLTFNGGGATSKMVTITYSFCWGITFVEEDFDGNNFPPACWTTQDTGDVVWSRVTQGGTNHPSLFPHAGTGMLQFYTNQTTTYTKSALLISPIINTNNYNTNLSFWMFRDNFSDNNDKDRVNIYISPTPTISGLTPVATYHRFRGSSPATNNYPAWNYYTLNLPTDTMNAAYVIFEGVSDSSYGVNLYLDDIQIEALIPQLTINPSILDFNNINTGTTSAPQIVTVSGTHLSGNITWDKSGTDTAAFTITQSSWDTTTGGTLNVSFSPTTTGDHNAILTVNSSGATTKTVTLNGTTTANHTIIATASSNGTITPSGTISTNPNANQKFIFSASNCYEIDSLWIDEIYAPDSIAAGGYTFNNVTENHSIDVSFKLKRYFTPISVVSCSDVPYYFDGQNLTSSGIYYDTLQTALGCDSIIELNLTVNPTYIISDTIEICQGDNYPFRGKTYTVTGSYRDTLQTIHGCDSIFELNLTINSVYLTSIFADICVGDSYNFHGNLLASPGIHIDTLQSILGCDSIIELTLTVNPTYFTSKTDTICQGETYFFGGQNITSSGVYYDTLQSISNCDSIIELTLTINPTYLTQVSESICEGESYNFNGNSLTTADIYYDTLQSIYHCDSIIELTLTVNPLPDIPEITKNDNILTSSVAHSHQWYFNNTPIAGATEQSYICTQKGNYFVEVTNEYDCSSKSEEINITDVSIVDIAKTDKIKVYPNPTKGELIIESGQSVIGNIEIFDIFGKNIGTYPENTKNETIIEISHLSTGIYFLRIQTNESVIVQKVIKE